MELEWINLEFATKNTIHKVIYHLIILNSEIYLPWQSYLNYKLLRVGIPIKVGTQSRYSEYLLMVKKGGKNWNW